MALGNAVPLDAYSLERFWQTDTPQQIARPVVSELSASLSEAGASGISLTAAQWHYILTNKGGQYLYNWADDPAEKNDLSSSPQGKPVMAQLNETLREIESNSSEPWAGPKYLFALSGSASSAPAAGGNPSKGSAAAIRPVGADQAYFHPSVTPETNGPSKSEEELLKTLPYQ